MRGVGADRALLLIQRCGERPLANDLQDVLWELFRVPCYAIQIDENGRTHAYECEAHEGLHTSEAENDRFECGCGRPGLIAVRPIATGEECPDRPLAVTVS